MVKAEVKKVAKGKKIKVMAQSRYFDSYSSEYDVDSMSFQLDERMIDHMFGGSTSYVSKRQYKMMS